MSREEQNQSDENVFLLYTAAFNMRFDSGILPLLKAFFEEPPVATALQRHLEKKQIIENRSTLRLVAPPRQGDQRGAQPKNQGLSDSHE